MEGTGRRVGAGWCWTQFELGEWRSTSTLPLPGDVALTQWDAAVPMMSHDRVLIPHTLSAPSDHHQEHLEPSPSSNAKIIKKDRILPSDHYYCFWEFVQLLFDFWNFFLLNFFHDWGVRIERKVVSDEEQSTRKKKGRVHIFWLPESTVNLSFKYFSPARGNLCDWVERFRHWEFQRWEFRQ